MGRSSKAAGDFTGRMTEKRALEQKDELERRQNEIATAQRLEQEHDDSVFIDYSDPDHPREVPLSGAALYDGLDADTVVEEETVTVADPGQRMIMVRPIETIEFTKGYGNVYSLKAGVRSLVPKHVADHLEEKGLIV